LHKFLYHEFNLLTVKKITIRINSQHTFSRRNVADNKNAFFSIKNPQMSQQKAFFISGTIIATNLRR